MNASLQALRTIPELKTALTTYNSNPAQGMTRLQPGRRVTSQLSNLFAAMDQTTESIPPFAFLQELRTAAPQFAEQSQHGGYAQQGQFGSRPLRSILRAHRTRQSNRRRRNVDPDHQFVAFLARRSRRGRIEPRFLRGRLPLGRLATDVGATSTLCTKPPG